MCIALLSTAHPLYPYIFLSNRDEFLNRPTAPAHWWQEPNSHVLGGRDLQRAEQGTWLAITKQGRIAILTNFREDGDTYRLSNRSRGAIPKAYLISPPETEETPQQFAQRLIEQVGVQDVGGFSLIFGELRPSLPGLNIISNRSSSAEDLVSIAHKPGQTHGLSNSHFGDMSWPKVVHGEQLLRQAIEADVSRDDENQSRFLESLFDILSIDLLPKRKDGEDWDTYVTQMRNSIMIPPVGGVSAESQPADKMASGNTGVDTPDHNEIKPREFGYGTQKQTVILVDRAGKVTFNEKTLYDGQGNRIRGSGGVAQFQYYIEGWR